MDMAITLIVLLGSIAGLIYLLRPEKPRKRQIPQKSKKAKSLPEQSKQAEQKSLKLEKGKPPLPQTEDEILMAEMRQAVRRYVLKNPGLSAQVIQDWTKKK